MDEIIRWFKNSFASKKEIEEEKPLALKIEDEDIIIPEKKKLSLKESYDQFMKDKQFINATQTAELMLEQEVEGAKKLLEKSLYAEYKQQLLLDKDKNYFLISQKGRKLKEILEAEYGVKYADELIKKIQEKYGKKLMQINR